MPANRVSPSTADYLTIALSPMLVMAMVGSLVFFLIEVFYSGAYQGRIQWIMFWFVMATVLITRISMVEGAQQAGLYGAALAVVTALVLTRFVDAVLLSWAIMALSWWCAHKLTWDSTYIDESEEPVGQGLLQSAGLDERLRASHEEPTDVRNQPRESSAASRRDKEQRIERDRSASGRATPPSALAWLRDHFGKRPSRAPGVWVVYFSLAALPLFGLGQLLIPAADVYRRRYAFLMLCIYLASGLGLLLTTTFLGLRRYLRSRRLEMPPAMTGAWLTIGALTAAAVLVLALLLPRPQAEYAISSLSGLSGTRQRQASRVAVLRDSPAQGDGRASNRPSDQPSDQQTSARPSQSGTARNESGEASSGSDSSDAQGNSSSRADQPSNSQANQSEDRADDRDGGGSNERAESETQDQSSQGRADEREQTDGQQSGEANDQQEQVDSGSEDDSRSSSSSNARQSSGDSNERASSDRQFQSDRQSGGRQSQSQSSTQSPQSPSPQSPGISPGSALLVFVKWLVYIALIGAAAYFGWRYRHDLIAGLGRFLEALGDFWRRLFGRGGRTSDEVDDETPRATPPRPFAQFRDPFADGTAGAQSLEELLRYSFDALDAWAREHGGGRGVDETPIEFCKRIAGEHPSFAAEARELGALYAGSTYGRVAPAASSRATLRTLWRHLTVAPATTSTVS